MGGDLVFSPVYILSTKRHHDFSSALLGYVLQSVGAAQGKGGRRLWALPAAGPLAHVRVRRPARPVRVPGGSPVQSVSEGARQF